MRSACETEVILTLEFPSSALALQPARIVDVTSSGMPFLPLLRSYSSFTFKRITEVQGGPKQVRWMLSSVWISVACLELAGCDCDAVSCALDDIALIQHALLHVFRSLSHE